MAKKKQDQQKGPGESGAPQEIREEMQEAQDEPVYDDIPAATLVRRRRWKKYRWLLWLLLLIPIIYFVVQVFIILAPRLQTEVALGDTMTDSLEVKGLVVLDSTPITGGGQYLYYTVPAGQRVSAGAEVAQRFAGQSAVEAKDRLAAIDQELDYLYEAQSTSVDGGDLELLLSQMNGGVQGILNAIETGNYAAVDGPVNEATLAANKFQIATRQTEGFQSRIDALNAQRAQYESLAQPIGTIEAPATGYFVPSMQNDRMLVDYESALQLDALQLQKQLQAEPVYYGGEVAGHIVASYKWYFFTVVSAKDALKFTVGDKSLHLNFPEAGETTVPVTVNSVQVDEQQDIAVVELYCEYVNADILQLRCETAEIVFGEQKGLLIKRSAMRLVDIEDENGLVTTYKGVYVQFGNMVYFKKIDILLEDEFYMLVSPVYEAGVNEVEMYDKVVVDSGGMELYDRKIL